MTERQIAVATNLELQRRFELLSKPEFDMEDWAESEKFLIEAEQDRRNNPACEEDHEDTPALDDPWFAHP